MRFFPQIQQWMTKGLIKKVKIDHESWLAGNRTNVCKKDVYRHGKRKRLTKVGPLQSEMGNPLKGNKIIVEELNRTLLRSSQRKTWIKHQKF